MNKYIAILFILFALPFWRMIDWAIIILPTWYVFLPLMSLWILIFILLPVRLLFKTLDQRLLAVSFLGLILLSYLSGPLSSMAKQAHEETQCGRMTYAGFFYPIRNLLSEAHHDDLELRNQLCMIRKHIEAVPDSFNQGDAEAYLTLMKNLLTRPEHRYRVALPAVLILIGKIYNSWDADGKFAQANKARYLVSELEFWSNQYAEEISDRDYGKWDWPHSSYIKFEYGLIENNWEKIEFEFTSK